MKLKIILLILIFLSFISCSILTLHKDFDKISIDAENGLGLYNIYVSKSGINSFDALNLIIVLDGDERCGEVYEYAEKTFDNFLIIGIGYTNKTRRVNDFTPTEAYNGKSGQANLFLQFIENEIFSIADSVILERLSDTVLVKRSIIGHSLGGLFAMYVLFNSTNFDYVVSLSPALYWDEHVIFGIEKNYYEMNDELNTCLYMSAGELETESMCVLVKAMEERLLLRKYKNFKFEVEYFPSENHTKAFYSGINRGLIFIRNNQ